ncbi:MAG: chitobiase/beta-hexosaminidase C-terminal domain-containing protein [Bacteroidales bacterium]|nr:chitobiase/beta-hexosaminidase C-terminal domain-containing protein [Bacteroidales bacterium]
MKRNLTFLLTALLLLTGMNVWAQSRTEITDVLNRELTGVTITSYTGWEGKTSNSDAVYAGNSAGGNESIQLRSNNSNSGIITTASGGTLTNVTVIWNSNTNDGRTLNVYGSHSAYTSPTELYNDETDGDLLGTIVKGESEELAISGSYEYLGLRSASGAMYLTEIDITWNTEGGTPQETVATPTFNPEAGTYSEAVSVTISCATEGATIYYTLDGSNPMEDGTVYTSAINITETTTVKAFAMKEGYLNSGVASATYTISEAPAPTLITIAEARALALNEYALVQGVVTFIDGRNVYIQDETAGIDLYLNNNTVPSAIALGDMVQAYGKRAAYNGLAELSGINGNDAEQFSILSSGNTLPLAVKTIAEILEGGADALQCTRVKVEGATIGAINTNGNTPLTQDGATINIYKVPALTGIEEGDMVDVISVIGYFNVPQLRVALANDVTLIETPSTSTITVTPTALSGFEYEFEAGGPSEIQYFTVSGDQLTNNVSVIPSEHFEVSTQVIEQFEPENPAMIYIPESGSFYDIQICVRLKAGLEAGTYNEQIAITSEEAGTVYVNVSGSVTGGAPTPPPTPIEGEYVRISDLSQLIAGSYVVFAARFDENATDYYAMTNASSGKPTGVLFSSTTNEGNEILPATITDEENSFYWIVGVTDNGYTFTNAAGEMIGYTSSTNFTTNGDNTEWAIELGSADAGAMVPNYSGFLVTNVNNDQRHFALNGNHNFGPYHSNNFSNNGYNFYLDLFVKAGGEPPVPPTPTVATPTFSPAAGTYTEAQSVSITCTTEGATIYYSTVSENGPWAPYSGAIQVEESMTIWAYAEKEGYNDSPVSEATYTFQLGMVTIFNQDWEGEMNGWTFVTVEGNKPWTVGQYQGNHYAYANGYNGGVNEQWCISPAFNINDYQNVILTFRNAKNYTGPDLELKYSTNYDGVDPTTASWWTFDFNISPGSYTWVESGDIPISIYPAYSTNCYIAFKYTSTENEAAAWEVDDIMLVGATSVPNLTVTPNSLSGFTHVVGEGPSESQYFTLSGVNIGPAPGGGSTGSIIIQSSENEFEVSLDNETFSWQVDIDGINGTLEPTPVYVRMNGPAVGQYTGTIEIYASSSDEATVSLSGTVTPQPVPGDDYVRITDMSQLVDGNRIVFAARFDENASDYYAMSNAASGKPEGVLFTSAFNGSDEILPSSILNEEDNFYWTVNVTADGYTFTNANGELIGYSSSTNFSPNGDNTAWSIEIGTSEETAMVPNYTGFVIGNVNNPNRAFALNGSHNFGPYHIQNMAGETYNFFLDIFMQGEGGPCTVAAPTFNPAGGTYYEGQVVAISCTTPDATVHYSLIPEPYNWMDYQGPITVNESMTIWAYAENGDCDPSPIVSAEYIIQDDLTIIFNQDWEEDWHGWTERCVYGDSLWRIASYQGNHYAYANGYNHPATEDWLISPAFDLDSYNNVVLTFLTAKNYTGDSLRVYFSNDYDGQDPTTATWQELECELSQGSWNWVESGEISLDEFSGSNCYIGFKYTCTDEEAAGWEVDDIMLTAGGGATPIPTLTATPNTINGLDYIFENGPSASQSYTLTGANLEGEGYITVTVSGEFEILNDDGNYSSSPFELHYSNGVIDNQPVTITVRLKGDLPIGPYPGNITHNGGGATATVSLSGTVRGDFEPNISAAMPLYIQGNNGSNNNRVPVAIQVTLLNLEPNTTYRYTNQLVDDNDGPETAGAGNVIYVNGDGFYRTTSPSLETEGNYGEFTTSANGSQIVWFMNEPTANARFTPGNHVYLRIRLNDGHNGTEVANTFTTDEYATVLNFGTENDEYSGSAFYVKSEEDPMSFAMLLSDATPFRPLYSTSVETTGVDFGSINQYADFYKEKVAGKDGWFGGILPNVNPNGVNRIVIWDLYSYTLNEYISVNGEWSPEANTVNPNAGLDAPIFIDLTDDGVEEGLATNVKVWSTDHEFVIENDDNAHYNITVYNILGQPMMMKQINAGSTERVSHSLATGIYIIRLQNNQNAVSVKVIVK